MADFLINDVDDHVIAVLEHRARCNSTSVEEEARRVLAASVGVDGPTPDAGAWRESARDLRERIGRVSGPNSTELLRAMRYPEEIA